MLKGGRYAVSFLQDTHTVANDELTWLREWERGFYMAHLNSNSSGGAFPLAPTFQLEILNVQEIIPGRLLYLVVCLDEVPLHFINVYVPRIGAM